MRYLIFILLLVGCTDTVTEVDKAKKIQEETETLIRYQNDCYSLGECIHKTMDFKRIEYGTVWYQCRISHTASGWYAQDARLAATTCREFRKQNLMK